MHDYDNYQAALTDYDFAKYKASTNAVGFQTKVAEIGQFLIVDIDQQVQVPQHPNKRIYHVWKSVNGVSNPINGVLKWSNGVV